jgi:TolB-like protein/Tfp pilus assembly protein PilF
MALSRKRLIFGEYEIDPDACELRKSGALVRLQPQPFKLLALLAQHSGEVVTRQQIEKELWGDQVHVDFEGGLNYCIKQIRAALQDDASTPRYVETLPKQGYRFIARVQRQQRSRPTGRIMMAVLPFGNLTGQADQEYFTDGMTEELIAQLSRLNPQRLAMIAFTSAKQYRDSAKSIDQIGRELNVDYIIEGSVRRAGNRVRIAVQLVEVSDQCHLWAEAYNRTVDDIITIQIDVAQRVARSLMVELLPDHRTEIARGTLVDPAAHDAYLRGRFYWNKRTEEALFKALKCFQTAIDRDPEYTQAYVGIADAYDIAAFYSTLRPNDAYQKSRAAITKALELDSAFAEAHTSFAYGKVLYEWDFKGAERDFKHALELNPNHVTGHYWYALFLAAMTRFDEALVQIGLALELDPLSMVVNSHKGWVLYFARRYDEAAVQLHSTLEMDDNFAVAWFFLGLVYMQKARYTDAAQYFGKARDASNDHPLAIAGLTCALARAGRKAAAQKVLSQLESTAKQRYVNPYYLALAYLGFNEVDRAFEYLEKACDDHSAYMSNIEADPVLDPLRNLPRFAALRSRVAAATGKAAQSS